MICFNCGKNIKENICPYCGKVIKKTANDKDYNKISKNIIYIFISIIIFILIICTIIYIDIKVNTYVANVFLLACIFFKNLSIIFIPLLFLSSILSYKFSKKTSFFVKFIRIVLILYQLILLLNIIDQLY